MAGYAYVSRVKLAAFERLVKAVEHQLKVGHNHDACSRTGWSYIAEPTGRETHNKNCSQERMRAALAKVRAS